MKKKLFAFDLDGTLLADSQTGLVPNNVKNAIKKLKKKGHIVCLFTGRPWRATEEIYNELDLDTVVVNYNGGHIHHPKQYNTFIPMVETIKTSAAMRIVKSNSMQIIASNIAVEGSSFLHVAHKKNNDHFTETFLKADDNTVISSPIEWSNMHFDPSGVLIEVKREYATNMEKVKDYFSAKFGDLAEFSFWETGPKQLPILEFTNPLARKDIALIRVARFYNISMSNTIAFGDGYNDLAMIKVAGIGVAMSNASEIVKQYANVVSHHSNKDGGVAKFINWYFKKGYDLVNSTVYSLTRNKATTEQLVTVHEED